MPELDVVRTVDPTEVEQHADPGEEPGTVICVACGASFGSQRGLNVHVGHVHPERPDLQVKTTRTASRTRRTRKPDFVESTDDKIAKWRQFIGNDVNNWLLLGASTPIVGISPLTFDMRPAAFGGATVADKIKFSPLETELLAQAIVRLDGTPFAASIVSAISGVAPYALGLGVCFVLLIHGYAIWRLRCDLPTILAQNTKGGTSHGKPNDAAQAEQPRPAPQFQAV